MLLDDAQPAEATREPLTVVLVTPTADEDDEPHICRGID
jgi:hypothetical protein